MKLSELDAPKNTRVASVMSSHFGKKINFENISLKEARDMLPKVRRILGEHRKTPKFHSSEKNPAYLELLMIEQALRDKVSEQDSTIPVDMDDQKTQSVMDKLERGQNLSPEEQKIANAVASQAADTDGMNESVQNLKESDIDQAQVVLAAKDLVDRVQKMIEDVSEIQYKDLPALVDQARTDLGTSEAEALKSNVSPALQELLQSLQDSKEKMDAGLAAVTGEEAISVPGEDEVDTDLDLEPEPELDVDTDTDTDDLGDLDLDTDLDDEDGELDPDIEALGRERR